MSCLAHGELAWVGRLNMLLSSMLYKEDVCPQTCFAYSALGTDLIDEGENGRAMVTFSKAASGQERKMWREGPEIKMPSRFPDFASLHHK